MLSYTRASSEPEFKLFPNACIAKPAANSQKFLANSMTTQEIAVHTLLQTMLLFLPSKSATAPDGISNKILVAW
jgi:hypothetical protein